MYFWPYGPAGPLGKKIGGVIFHDFLDFPDFRKNMCFFLKSGHKTSKKTNSVYANCHKRKLLNLFSPLVLISKSGSGIFFVNKFNEIVFSLIKNFFFKGETYD